ncbi:DsbA family protein [Pseudoalteromonas luteoviolacea]|uniref:DsbA family protein n=1 Tax=Pseudoalteromonas luteoviolacea TaxID=43657 RepID=UPI0011522DB0|nr:DsbA family protein [Pseudoalteromonas luteoviolacea]TQF70060.1 DsbA family protein [Pseudoalteromonas luteoviolacea]
MRFIYVMDPMCGWCYGFQPELEEFLERHSDIEVDWIMGGLAPDTNQPMEQSLRETISSYWYQIEERTKVAFNHDYWALNTPYRSTYLACRAVIVSQSLSVNSAQKMVEAIQSAYYQQAKNPSLEETLIECASSIGLDADTFKHALSSNETENVFQQHLDLARRLNVSGFPALFYVNDLNHAYPLTLGYCQAKELEQRFEQVNDSK